MEAINQESVVYPGDTKEVPVSVTTTDVNYTGNWKFVKPVLEESIAPCKISCPLGINISSYFYKLSKQDIKGALAILRQENPLPSVLGRVCPNFCEKKCNRGDFDQSVSIGTIEQYLGDIGLSVPYFSPSKWGNKKVAVVGSGPGGIAAAYFLSRRGINVTIFEKEKSPGGLLRYGIPRHRLSADILDREIENIMNSLNIELVCGQDVESEQISLLLKEYDYIFCSPGLGSSIITDDFAGNPKVLHGLELLNRINKGYIPEANYFVVIGGGNVAVDIARSLIRLNKKVEIVYRRTIKEMPAYPEEKKHLIDEGISVIEKRLISKSENIASNLDEKLHLIVKEAVNIGGKISEGMLAGTMDVDALIMAIGQKKSMELPSHERILIGGDYTLGDSSVAEAMASGKMAAFNIIKNLGINDDTQIINPSLVPNKTIIGYENLRLDYMKKSSAMIKKEVSVSERLKSFISVYEKLDEDAIRKEIERCFNCGVCTGCDICWFFCPDNAITLKNDSSGVKVAIDMEHCKGCGLCSESCPRGIISMEEDI